MPVGGEARMMEWFQYQHGELKLSEIHRIMSIRYPALVEKITTISHADHEYDLISPV